MTTEKEEGKGRRFRPKSLSVEMEVFITTHLAATAPLVRSTNLFDNGHCPIDIQLDHPLCPPQQSSLTNDLHGDIASVACVCAQMHVLIEKESQFVEGDQPTEVSDMVWQSLDRLYGTLQDECRALLPDHTLPEALKELGMVRLFPLVARRLQIESDEERAVGFREYLVHMSQMHQVVAMSQQLQEDIPTSNHKYMAHQVALLYQCLSFPNLGLQRYKRRIEPEFDEIKARTERASVPALSERQKDWLWGITDEVMQVAVDLRGDARDRKSVV